MAGFMAQTPPTDYIVGVGGRMVAKSKAKQANSPQHPAEAPRVVAALAAMVFWAVGLSLMDGRFGLGATLCAVTVVWTAWLYWADLISAHSRPWKAWPWLGILLLTIEIAAPGWLIANKGVGQETEVKAAPTQRPSFGMRDMKINGFAKGIVNNGCFDQTFDDVEIKSKNGAVGIENNCSGAEIKASPKK
jgi:hypothetical protein